MTKSPTQIFFISVEAAMITLYIILKATVLKQLTVIKSSQDGQDLLYCQTKGF
jgi:hypothetical protein